MSTRHRGWQSPARHLVPVLIASLVATALGITGAGSAAPAAASGGPHIAGGFEFIKTLAPQPGQCAYNGGFFSNYFVRGDCVRIDFSLSGTETGTHTVKVQLRS